VPRQPNPRHWLAEGADTPSLASPFACAVLPVRWPLSVPGASGFALRQFCRRWPNGRNGAGRAVPNATLSDREGSIPAMTRGPSVRFSTIRLRSPWRHRVQRAITARSRKPLPAREGNGTPQPLDETAIEWRISMMRDVGRGSHLCPLAPLCTSARCSGAISVLPIGWISRPSAPASIWSAGWKGYAGRSARPSCLGHTRRRDRSIADTARNARAARYRISMRRLHRAGVLSHQASHLQTHDTGYGGSALNYSFGRSFAGMRAALSDRCR